MSKAGRAAWESKDRAVPSDYRTILWVMDFHGAGHFSTLNRLFPGEQLAGCLAEMIELGLIEAADQSIPPEPPAPVYTIRSGDLAAAKDSLDRHGAYVAEDRLEGRRKHRKKESETTVLIVEDDPDQLALADLRVSMAGYAVRVADSEASFLRSMAEHGLPDLILLDVMLPDGNGLDILARLRRLPATVQVPVVLLTAMTDPDDIVKGLSLGADGYITKPYSKSLVAKVIERILNSVPSTES